MAVYINGEKVNSSDVLGKKTDNSWSDGKKYLKEGLEMLDKIADVNNGVKSWRFVKLDQYIPRTEPIVDSPENAHRTFPTRGRVMRSQANVFNKKTAITTSWTIASNATINNITKQYEFKSYDLEINFRKNDKELRIFDIEKAFYLFFLSPYCANGDNANERSVFYKLHKKKEELKKRSDFRTLALEVQSTIQTASAATLKNFCLSQQLFSYSELETEEMRDKVFDYVESTIRRSHSKEILYKKYKDAFGVNAKDLEVEKVVAQLLGENKITYDSAKSTYFIAGANGAKSELYKAPKNRPQESLIEFLKTDKEQFQMCKNIL